MDTFDKCMVLFLVFLSFLLSVIVSTDYTKDKICELKSGVMIDNKCLVDKVEVK